MNMWHKKIGIVFCASLFYALAASSIFGKNPIDDLSSALQSGGVSTLLQVAKSSGFAPPSIPSKWHLENRAKTYDEKQTAIYAREFGFSIVEAIEDEERMQRDLFADEALFKQTLMLLDFSDWCMETVGWGNMVLANQCLELAAAASARLAANTNFPIGKCEKIVLRLSPEWMKPRARAEVFNVEAGTNLFTLAFVESKEELDMACGAGWFLMEFANKNPPPDFRMPPNKSLNIATAKKNLDFFEEYAYLPNNISLRSFWDYRMFECFRGGFGYHIYREAEGILDFRKTIGHFPEKYARSDAEQKQLEKDIIEYAKVGIKITPAENEPSFDPIREAFRRAWNKRPNRMRGDENKYENAFMAYKKVTSGAYGGREFSDNNNDVP
jgi:hypothetical protein